MNKENLVWMAAGGLMGVSVAFYDVDTPTQNDCVSYRIHKEPVTSYVLTPPPPIIRPMACPPSPKCEAAKEEVLIDNVVEDKKDEPTRKHRRHRQKRYWR